MSCSSNNAFIEIAWQYEQGVRVIVIGMETSDLWGHVYSIATDRLALCSTGIDDCFQPCPRSTESTRTMQEASITPASILSGVLCW